MRLALTHTDIYFFSKFRIVAFTGLWHPSGTHWLEQHVSGLSFGVGNDKLPWDTVTPLVYFIGRLWPLVFCLMFDY